jgi:hypothetical protein
MKPLKSILFSVSILVLGLLLAAARTQMVPPAQPKASAGLSPGDYLGTFHFNTREISVDSMKRSSNSWDVKDNRLISVDGELIIYVTGPDKGIIIVNPTNYLIYDIRDISAVGSNIECKMTGYMEMQTNIYFLSSLTNNYYPQKGSFTIPFWIENWSIENFKNLTESNTPACTQQVNEKTLEALVQNFFNQFFKHSPMIFRVTENSGDTMSGTIYLDGYDKTTDVPGGWTQRELRGGWFVTKQPVKNNGWKQ